MQLRADRPIPASGEPDLVREVLDVCREIIADCNSEGLPSVIENLVYELPGEQLSGKAREDAIIAAAVALDELDIDLLKLEYPGSAEGLSPPGGRRAPPLGCAVGRSPLRAVQ